MIFGPICDGGRAKSWNIYLNNQSIARIHEAQWWELKDFSPKHDDFLYCIRCPNFRGNC